MTKPRRCPARKATKTKPSKRAATKSGASTEMAARLAALDKVQAVIEFAMDGTIERANENFLEGMGYQLEEIVGKHHSIRSST